MGYTPLLTYEGRTNIGKVLRRTEYIRSRFLILFLRNRYEAESSSPAQEIRLDFSASAIRKEDSFSYDALLAKPRNDRRQRPFECDGTHLDCRPSRLRNSSVSTDTLDDILDPLYLPQTATSSVSQEPRVQIPVGLSPV